MRKKTRKKELEWLKKQINLHKKWVNDDVMGDDDLRNALIKINGMLEEEYNRVKKMTPKQYKKYLVIKELEK